MSAVHRAPRVPFALLVTAVVVGGLGLLLALNTASAANELERHNLAMKDQNVAAQVQQLRNEVALSAAPGNLSRAATELGMVPAGNPAFIVLGADGSATVLGKPKAVVGTPFVIAPTPTKATTKPTASATPSTTKTPAATTTPSATKTSGRSSKTSGHSTKTRGARGAAPSKAASSRTPAPRTPSATPTPTLTLPGGH